MGMMTRISRKKAEAEWGSELHVASLAALAKGDETFRILHDGTHGVKVNPKIRVRDQSRFPSSGRAEGYSAPY